MSENESPFGFETLAIHAGGGPDPATGARSTPIYQTTAYVFDDADHAASLFNLQTYGFIYSRLTNPTVSVLEERVAALEGGKGGTATASGHAAQMLALFPLMQPGSHLLASNKLYGGSVTQFTRTFAKFGLAGLADRFRRYGHRAGRHPPGNAGVVLRVARQSGRHRQRPRSACRDRA